MIAQSTRRSTATALAAVVVFTAQSMYAQHAVVFTETAGSLTETYDSNPIGNWGTAIVTGSIEMWLNTGLVGDTQGPTQGQLTWTEPVGDIGFNVVDGATAFSENPFESAPQPLSGTSQTGTVVIDASGDTVVASVTFIDNGDTTSSVPGGVPVPDNTSTVSMLMMAGGALGLARQRNLGHAVARPAA